MSKRLRVEQELAAQLRQEGEEDDVNLKKQQEKIFAPVCWGRTHSGFKITDVTATYYAEIVEMIKSDFIPNDVLCKNSEIEEDEVSLQSLLDHIMFTLKDSTSIMALSETDEDELAGALLLRVITKVEYGRVFSRVTFKEGEARRKCLEMTTALNRKVDIYKLYNCDVFLRYYLLCVKPQYRKKNLGYQLMRLGLDVARSLHIPIVSGIFNNFSLQKCARKLDFKLMQEISYTNWRDKNNELIFSDPGAGNYTCALMVCEVPQAAENAALIKELSPKEMRVIPPPQTRAEKRARKPA